MQAVNHVWVDDDGSCRREGVHLGDWHVYSHRPDPYGHPQRLLLRCPATLSPDERERLSADVPPGRITAILQTARDGLRASRGEQRDAVRGKYSWEEDGA
jgi:hypothetical protein